MTYVIRYSGTYPEDAGEVLVADLAEVKAWINANRASYNFNLDNLEIYPASQTIDVYALMQEEGG